MINDRALEELLQEPLGPYRDRDVLHETACQMKGFTELVLYSFILEHDGRVTGLDESEHPQEGEDNRKFRFRGVLKIANPEWLSAFGVKIVEEELNLRVRDRAFRLGEGGRSRAHRLTLDDLFARHLTKSHDATWRKEEDLRLTVLIQGEKNMPANFMHSNRVPNGLLWCSESHRRYQVATMDVETYALSQTFFWRWRLLALMEKIDRLYPFIPPKIRTPMWFVTKYISTFACPPEDKHRRLIFDEKDTDVDETGATVTPRHLLRPHQSEILGLFAAHARWLIANNVVKGKKLFDIGSWARFAQEARRQRKAARDQGIVWGWCEGQEGESSEEEEEDEEDKIRNLVRQNPVIGKSNQAVVRKIQLAQARSHRETHATFSSDPESEEDAPCRAEYVSDFSESSDGEEEDSDPQLAEDEAMDQIPWQLREPPILPDVDGRWWCPLEGCNYQIDLYDLTTEEERGVPEELVGYISQKQWRSASYDEKVLKGFQYMVTNHYVKHFEECGVKAERRDGRVQFAFIDGRRRHHNGEEPIRKPTPAQGVLRGESRVVPIVHAHVEHF